MVHQEQVVLQEQEVRRELAVAVVHQGQVVLQVRVVAVAHQAPKVQ